MLKVCASTRGHPLTQPQENPPTQTDSPMRSAQHGEEQLNQVSLLLTRYNLHACAIHMYNLYYGMIRSENNKKKKIVYFCLIKYCCYVLNVCFIYPLFISIEKGCFNKGRKSKN